MSETVAAEMINFARVLDELRDPVAVCDATGQLIYVNRLARAFLGIAQGAALPGLNLTQRETFSQMRLQPSEDGREEYFLGGVSLQGCERETVSVSLAPMGDGNYRVLFEPETDERLAPIIDQIDALVAICDGRRQVRLANAALTRVLGLAPGEDPECDLLDIFAPEDRPRLRVAASRALAGTMPEPVFTRLVGSDLPDGGEQVQVRIRPISPEEGSRHRPMRGLVVVVQPSQSSLEELKRRFARAEELMSLGQLAAGVAHELKNPLTSILNYADYLLRKYRGQLFDPRDGERLQHIIEGVERIDRFVRDLLNLAGTEGATLEEVELHGCIRTAVGLCEVPLEQHQVEVRYELAEAPLALLGHAGGLQQIFVNLITNAARAMEGPGGRIDICTRVEGDEAVIEVRDNACGMAPSVLDRAFEPFFTTSTNGKGSGLGLSLVGRIVEQHGGSVSAESEEGSGTTFTVRLPVLPTE